MEKSAYPLDRYLDDMFWYLDEDLRDEIKRMWGRPAWLVLHFREPDDRHLDLPFATSAPGRWGDN